MSSVGRISLDLNVNSKNFNKQVDGIQKHTTRSFSMMSVAVGNIIADMATRAVQGIGDFVKDSINKGSELSELQNVVDSVFTSMADDVDRFSKNALSAYGLTEKQAKKMVGTFGAMSKSFGYGEKQAYAMSTALTGLAGDVASFYNLSIDEAYTKLKSVYTGETESLKELGVVMTQTALDEFALSKGLSVTTSKMSEQQKVALRLAFVQERLNTASGDFLRTQDQWANQTRILTGQIDSLKAAIGQGLINVLTPAIKTVNVLIGKLVELANTFQSFTAMLMGKSKGGGTGSAMKEVAEAAGMASNSTLGIEDAANGAAEAAKEAKKSLMGFDELNVLQKQNKSSDVPISDMIPVGSGSIDLGNAFEGSESTLGKKLEEIFSKINFEPIKESFAKLKDAVLPVIETISNAIKWFMSNVLAPLGAWVIEDALPAFFNVLAGVFKVLNPLLLSLKPLLTWLWENFLAPIASWTGGVIVSVLNAVATALDKIGTWMSNNQSVVNVMTTTILGFFAAWKTVELLSFIQQSGGVIAMISNLVTSFGALAIAKAKDIADTIVLNLLYAKDFIVSLASTTAALVKQAAQWVATTALKVADTAATVANTVATGAATVATWAFNAALAVLTSPITLVIAAIAALVAGVVLLIKHFDKVKAVAQTVFNAMTSFARNAVNGILSAIETMVNGVISGFNLMIRAINSLAIDIPDWIPKIGGKKIGFSIKEISKVSLPKLAEGGYVRANQPQPVIVGDNKTQGEIISPEGKMLEVVMQALESFFGRLMASGYSTNQNGSVGDIVIPIYLDGTMLDEVIVTAQQRRDLRSGGR